MAAISGYRKNKPPFPRILNVLKAGTIVKHGDNRSKNDCIPVRLGIHTVLDLKQAHSRTFRDKFSVVMAKTIAELNGQACYGLEDAPPPKQAIASTRSFGIKVTDIESLKESITLYTSSAAEKARAQQSYANSITVFIQTSFFTQSSQYSNALTVPLPSPSNDTRHLVKAACWALKRIYRTGYVYEKAGVILNNLVPKAGVQADLFFSDTIGKTG